MLFRSTFHLCETVGQGEAYAALTGSAVRRFGERDPQAMVAMGEALSAGGSVEAVASAIEAVYAGLGLATRLRDLGVPEHMLEKILHHALQNFNADANREFLKEVPLLGEVLRAAW